MLVAVSKVVFLLVLAVIASLIPLLATSIMPWAAVIPRFTSAKALLATVVAAVTALLALVTTNAFSVVAVVWAAVKMLVL